MTGEAEAPAEENLKVAHAREKPVLNQADPKAVRITIRREISQNS